MSPASLPDVLPHLAKPLAPPLHPATREPIGPDDLAPLFPMALSGVPAYAALDNICAAVK